MRIIAGEFRGRRLLDPADQATRPITDRVKQSLFDQLAPLLEDATVYDIFAGTGSLGLEAISRGAASVVFYERHPPAVARLRRNIDTLGLAERCTVVVGDVFARLPERDDPPADIAFLDPPYAFIRDRPAEIQRLLGHLAGKLAPDGTIVLRHDARDRLDPPSPLREVGSRVYGEMALRFLTLPAPPG